MAFQDAIVALQQNWDDLMARLDADGRDQLAGMLSGLDGPELPRLVTRLTDFFAEMLPRDHPVRLALVSGPLFAPATLDWQAITRHLRKLALAGSPRLGDQLADGAILRDVADIAPGAVT